MSDSVTIILEDPSSEIPPDIQDTGSAAEIQLELLEEESMDTNRQLVIQDYGNEILRSGIAQLKGEQSFADLLVVCKGNSKFSPNSHIYQPSLVSDSLKNLGNLN